MEREVILSGIGGQGVQLAGQVLARAAAREDRQVMLFGSYGGTMRGGPTEATVVVGDEPIGTPPIVSSTWSAVAVHHAFFEPLQRKLRQDSVVLLNDSLFEGELDREAYRVFDVPATKMAAELASPLGASLVLVGAHAALTGLVSIESLVAGMRDSVPAYRREHLETNERVLRAGFDSVERGVAPAWEGGR
jgi:Pyruvate/2-oxoacid:ferredoxin oxidoreductase gamma subunit